MSTEEKDFNDIQQTAGNYAVQIGQIAIPDAQGNIHIGNIVYTKTEVEELQETLRDAVNTLRNRLTQRILEADLASYEHPYRYLDYFDLEHRKIFYGRDKARKVLLEHICNKQQKSRLTLLHARSGAGKTSLLRAGLIPALLATKHLPVYIHHPYEPVATIKQTILPNAPYPERLAALPLRTFLSWASKHLEHDETLVILLDQFEEFFIQLVKERQHLFIDALADCYQDEALPVKFVLAMRKDYFSEMAIFAQSLKSVFQNQFLLSPLTRDEATRAIESPLDGSDIRWEPKGVGKLLNYLAQGDISAPDLQLTCSRLYEIAKDSGQKVISVKGVNLRSIHADYLKEEMSAQDFLPKQRDLGWLLLKRLVTSEGTKQVYPPSKLYEIAPKNEVDPILDRLINRRLLRRDEQDGEVLIEVAHDTLAAEIATHENPQERREKVARELVERGLATWRQFGHLMDLSTLSVLDQYRDDLINRDSQVLEFIFRSALTVDYEVIYWAKRAKEVGVEVDEIALYLSRLRQFLVKHYDRNELQTLCLGIGVDYESLSGTSKQARAHELVKFMERLGRLHELVTSLEITRPKPFVDKRLGIVSIKKLYGEYLHKNIYDSEVLTLLHEALNKYFSKAEIHSLCFELSIEHEDLSNENRDVLARELVMLMERKHELDRLVTKIQQMRPHAFKPGESLAKLRDIPTYEENPTLTIPEHSSPILWQYSSLYRPNEYEENYNNELVDYLPNFFQENYNDYEFHVLCLYGLNIEYNELSGKDITDKVYQLVSLLKQQNRLDELFIELWQTCPNLFDQPDLSMSTQRFIAAMRYDASLLADLAHSIVKRFDERELWTLCFSVKVDYENLGGTHYQKAEKLVWLMKWQGRLDILLTEISSLRPAWVKNDANLVFRLIYFIVNNLDQNDFSLLCSNLGVFYAQLDKETKYHKVTDFVLLVEHLGQLDKLLQEVNHLHPTFALERTWFLLEFRLYKFITDNFNLSELHDLLFGLIDNMQTLREKRRNGMTQELVLLMKHSNQIGHLLATLQQKRPVPFHKANFGADLVALIDNGQIEKCSLGIPTGSRLPFVNNKIFTGRTELLKNLARALLDDQSVPLILTQVAEGVEGIGKSQLALEFAYQFGGFFCGVHWIDASRPEGLQAEVAACGAKIWKNTVYFQGQLKLVESTLKTWKNNGRRLVILDNLEEIEAARKWMKLLVSTSSRVLITSRRNNWPNDLGLVPFALNVFTLEECLTYLRNYISEEQSSDDDLKKLAERLGHVPLTTTLAGCYLKQKHTTSVSDYLDKLDGILTRDPNETGLTRIENHIENILMAAFTLNWEQIIDSTTRQLFILMGYCAPNHVIPYELLEEATDLDRDTSSKALDILSKLGLLENSKTGPIIHPVICQYARQQALEVETLSELVNVSIRLVRSGIQYMDRTNEISHFRLLQPHIHLVAEWATKLKVKGERKLWESLGYYFRRIADYPNALLAYKRVLEIDEHIYGLERPELASSNNNIGLVLEALGDYEGAKTAFRQALSIDQKTYGHDHLYIARDLNNLGRILDITGDYKEAQLTYERALLINEHAYGLDHPNVARILDDLGALLCKMNLLVKAQAIYERIIVIDQEFYGEGHPMVARDLNHLGGVLYKLDNHEMARKVYTAMEQIFEYYNNNHPYSEKQQQHPYRYP